MKRNRLKIRVLIILWALLLVAVYGRGQHLTYPEVTPGIVVKSNVLSDFSTSLNLGLEVKLATRITLDLPFQYNPWTFSQEKKIRHFLFQPEVRYWLCESFLGTFIGFHLHTARYNIGGVGLSDYMKEHRHDGWLVGGGASIGHHWILSSRWALEATLGFGYAYMDHEVYPCEVCAEKIKDKQMHYLGPTRAGISLVYLLK